MIHVVNGVNEVHIRIGTVHVGYMYLLSKSQDYFFCLCSKVTYQLKILTTALFSVFILNKALVKLQWLSLFMLFIGVSMVQLQPTHQSSSHAKDNASDETVQQEKVTQQSPVLGLVAVILSSLCSGFAG